jgi:NAD(P)-dependent dehydrogenase (short-subunit alcohol dehydrogenase family)
MIASIESEFAGKRALVTGGTRGIGEAIVERLRGAGAKVITTSRSTPHGLRQPELFVEADLSTAEGVETVVSGVRERLAGVDILIHNVGGSAARGGGFAVLTDEEWQHALNSNLLAAVRLDRGLLPWMLKQGAGVIIHVSSIQRTLPLYRLHPRVRRRQGGPDELQQGALEGGRAQRDSREHGRARLH